MLNWWVLPISGVSAVKGLRLQPAQQSCFFQCWNSLHFLTFLFYWPPSANPRQSAGQPEPNLQIQFMEYFSIIFFYLLGPMNLNCNISHSDCILLLLVLVLFSYLYLQASLAKKLTQLWAVGLKEVFGQKNVRYHENTAGSTWNCSKLSMEFTDLANSFRFH